MFRTGEQGIGVQQCMLVCDERGAPAGWSGRDGTKMKVCVCDCVCLYEQTLTTTMKKNGSLYLE